MININWRHLNETTQKIRTKYNLNDNSAITFHFSPAGLTKKKQVIKFGDFLKFIWTLYDNPNIRINNLAATDEKGTVIFKHSPVNSANENIPERGNGEPIQKWNKLGNDKKETLMKILLSQINSEVL